MDSTYRTFTLSIFLLVIGIVVIYRATLQKTRSKSAASNRVISRISFRVSKYFRPVDELVGITTSEILLELSMRVGLLFSIILLLMEVFSLNVLQVALLTIISSSIIALWIQGVHRRYIKKYVEEFELDFSDFVESLALAVNSGLPLFSGLNRVIAEHLKEDSSTTSKFSFPRILSFFGLHPKSGGPRLGTPPQREGHTPLQRELILLQERLNDGLSVSSSFASMSLRLNSALVSNFSDAVTLGLNRGTPLAHMLSDHADSMRESQKRILLERAGRAEVKMMVPVVFLLLPISVLFALWPSFQQLQQMVIIP